MKRTYSMTAAAVIFGLALAACNSNGPRVLNPGGGGGGGNTVYTQTELFARPAVKEGLEMFKDHDATNRTEPYSDATLTADIGTFVTTVAKRDAPTTQALQQILGLDEMTFDTSSASTTAGYLGVEIGGKVPGYSTFGGRSLNDDVIDLDLNAVFGDTLAKLGVVKDDGNESPCLTTDNVGAPAWDQPAVTNTFPYVQPPV